MITTAHIQRWTILAVKRAICNVIFLSRIVHAVHFGQLYET